MGPLTRFQPKPLLPIAGKPLIDYQLRRLKHAGYRSVMINVSWLGEQIVRAIGCGQRYGLKIDYSFEKPAPLNTAGAVARVLDWFDNQPFLLVNADVWTDYPFQFPDLEDDLGFLVLIDNPNYHPSGDFYLDHGRIGVSGERAYTYAGIGFYRPGLFEKLPNEVYALKPLLDSAIVEQRISGALYRGQWEDVGTPKRLRDLDQAVRQSKKNNRQKRRNYGL